ncbi:MAG: acyl-CoA thioesterase [Gemmatimonadaceae bacterium]
MTEPSTVAPIAPFAVELRVRYAETDQMGVVYHAEYLVWCEVGRTEFIRAHVRSYAELEGAGVVLAVAEASLRYHAGARYDDLVRVETRLVSVRSRTLRFEYLVRRATTGERLVSAATTLIAVDPAGGSMVIPPAIRAALEAHVG